MSDSVARMRILVLGFLFAFVGVIWSLPIATLSENKNLLTVAFLDVGQGDAIFIESPEGVQMLIDGGPNASVVRKLAEVMPSFDMDLDIVLATHPDADHIGGLVDVLERYDVEMVIRTESENDSSVSRTFTELVNAEGAKVVYARKGQEVALGASTTIEILFPETDTSDMESNTSSIVLKLTHGETAFLLTGDSPKNIEEYLVLTEGEHLRSTVLKAGHHGSRTSTSELFLAEVQPEYAVVSAGKDNRYGHPHVEVTDALFNAGVEVLSTADIGTIVFTSDGETVKVE